MKRRVRFDARPESDTIGAGDQTRSWREGRAHRRGRDVAAWMALGLGVAVSIVITTHHAATGPSERHSPSNDPTATIPIVQDASHRAALREADETATTVLSARTSTASTTETTTRALSTVISASTTSTSRSTATSAPPSTTAPSTQSPTTTDPQPPAAQSPRLATTIWRGRLSFPNDIATTYVINTTGGSVAVSSAWAGSTQLSLAVACPGQTRTKTATLDASVSVTALAGTCEVTISELADATGVAAYQLNASYEAAS